MNCNDVRENLIELLTDGPADPQVKAHVSQCSACTEELGSCARPWRCWMNGKRRSLLPTFLRA